MTRHELAKAIEDGDATILYYRTPRDFENFLLNRALEDDATRWHQVASGTEPKTIVLVVQTRMLDSNRAGEIIP